MTMWVLVHQIMLSNNIKSQHIADGSVCNVRALTRILSRETVPYSSTGNYDNAIMTSTRIFIVLIPCSEIASVC